MKREYKKPMIAVESFQLDAAIAASCSAEGKEPLGVTAEVCVHDSSMFTTACEYWNIDNNDEDGMCYQTFDNAQALFLQS